MTDPCSNSSCDLVTITHIDLDWVVNFDSKTISGVALLHVSSIAENQNVNTIILDSKEIDIYSVSIGNIDKNVDFTTTDQTSLALGTSLTIKLPAPLVEKDQKCLVFIKYTTSPNASCLQWLDPSLDTINHLPYLYSQCQAIHARSFIPLMDTPSIKYTYTARVTIKNGNLLGMRCLMSALEATPEETFFGSKTHCPPCYTQSVTSNFDKEKDVSFYFRQPVSIPSYLMAIIVGNVVKRDISPRVAVWSCPDVIDRVEYEFAETEVLLSTAERLLGPYVWTRYDVVCMPFAYPYGGMENPCLTFVSPSVLAGDRSLVSVIAHEICHSWAGNLVTPRQWSDFALNEGFTVFCERKVLTRVAEDSAKKAGEANFKPIDYFNFLMCGGKAALEQSIARYGNDHPATKLVVEYSKGDDPDDYFSTVPYEKGCSFLYALEKAMGGSKAMETLLQKWYAAHKYACTDLAHFREYATNYAAQECGINDLDSSIDWKMWYHTPGMPSPQHVSFPNKYTNVIDLLVENWVTEPHRTAEAQDISNFTPLQKAQFLEKLLTVAQQTPGLFSTEALTAMDTVYGFVNSGNYEIKFAWLMFSLQCKYEPSIIASLGMLRSVGRMKFVRPLFRTLRDFSTNTKAQAINFFQEHGGIYHPICKKMVERDLDVV